jgi:multidrug efflux system membrane fusion protein
MTFLPNTGKNEAPARRLSGTLRRHWWLWLLAACLLGSLVYSRSVGKTGEAGKRGPGAAAQKVAVAAAPARLGDIPIYLTGLGSVTSLRTVTVKSRVDGELMKVNYREGQIVKKGELLAEIDPRPYQAQLTQAQGQMVRDQALLQNARLDLERYRTLSQEDSIAKQQYDTQKSLVRQMEGTVKFDQGQIDNAKLQLTYSRITAPVSGRIGLRAVDPGNIIHATDTTGLAVITQLEPITVVFTIPEDSLPEVQDKLQERKRLAVDAYNREQTRKLSSGALLTMDNQIDPASGTVRLKAEFANKDHRLFPNQFVNAHLLLDTLRGVVVIPTAAIQRSTQGTFVFLIKPDQTVAMRRVRLGPTAGDEAAVEEGLKAGDRVVVEGLERLREGSKVVVKGSGAGTPRPNNGKDSSSGTPRPTQNQ